MCERARAAVAADDGAGRGQRAAAERVEAGRVDDVSDDQLRRDDVRAAGLGERAWRGPPDPLDGGGERTASRQVVRAAHDRLPEEDRVSLLKPAKG